MEIMICSVAALCAILVGSFVIVKKSRKKNSIAVINSSEIIMLIKAREALDKKILKSLDNADKRTVKIVKKWLKENSGDII